MITKNGEVIITEERILIKNFHYVCDNSDTSLEKEALKWARNECSKRQSELNFDE